MTDTAIALIPQYGAWLLALVTFGSCLAIPVPSSLMMLAAGAFVASGDLDAWSAFAGALGGAIAGDNAGYLVGRAFTARVDRIAARKGRAGDLARRAADMVERRGGIGVFLSRWLVSPLGPYVNLVAGATSMTWARFALWGAGGEVVWVSIYTGLGYVFADSFIAVGNLAGNMLGALAAGAIAVMAGRALFRRNGGKARA